ncbi:MAG: NAD kinase [Candidatus Binatia bacterium]
MKKPASKPAVKRTRTISLPRGELRFAFLASATESAQEALEELSKAYVNVPVEEADVLVPLGGDGFLLQTLHRHMESEKPVFGMKQGTLGFLMNKYAVEGLAERVRNGKLTTLRPLEMVALSEAGSTTTAIAINEVSLIRQTRQAARLRLSVDDKVRIEELSADGVLVATPAGSTAYNFSANGPILPFGSNLLALTAISPAKPRRWHGALIPDDAHIRFDVLDHYKRPASATADAVEVRDVVQVDVRVSPDRVCTLLFDPDSHLEDRIANAQFA